MSRIGWLFAVSVLLGCAQVASAGDLPPGALVRLGDDSYRAGGEIKHLALSPDGKQFATTRDSGRATLILTVWDADTGRPIRSQEINTDLFKGFVWGPTGGFAVVLRGEPAPKGATTYRAAKVIPDDFRVWEFTDPKGKAPPLLPAGQVGLSGFSGVEAVWPRDGAEYTDFAISAGGSRLAAKHLSTRDTIHVFELKPADTVAKLERAGTIDLGAEGVNEIRISADGKTVVTFRELAKDDEMTATVWDVATGKPAKPVRVPRTDRLMVAPDARSLVAYVAEAETESWGFDHYDLTTGKRRILTRWKTGPCFSHPGDWGGFTFTPSGSELIVVTDCKVRVIDLKAGKERGRLEGHTAVGVEGGQIVVAVSADGARIATADASGLIRLWDAKTLRAINEAPGHRAPVEYAQLSPDGKRLLTWAPDRTVRLWDLATGKELRAFTGTRRFDRGSDKPTFTPDGTAILYSDEKRLLARDLQTGLEVPLPGGMKELESRFAVFAPDSKSVLTWNEQGACEVWSWPGGKEHASWNSEAAGFAPGFSPDGSVIFPYPTSPERWDATTGKKLPPAWKDDRENELAAIVSLRPNPQWLVHSSMDSPGVIEAGTGKRVTRFRLVVTISGWGVLSPTGRQSAGVLSVQFEQLIQNQKEGWFAILPTRVGEAVLLNEIATGNARRELRGHRGEVRVLGFTPDGNRLLTAGGDHTILVWDMRLQNVPLPDALKKETDAAKLWDTLATGNAKGAYLAMARLARDPEAAVKMAKRKLKPATKSDRDTDATGLADARAIELLESLGTDASRELLKELAGGHADAFRTQEAKRALERNKQ